MNSSQNHQPIALAIGGSDSSGGAGIQADLKVWCALKVYGASALTCVTAQQPGHVREVRAVPPALVQAQIEAVFAWAPPQAVKTGMLYSEAIIESVVQVLQRAHPRALVVDPVMVAAGGDLLIRPRAALLLAEQLLPMATVFTPNIFEAQWLLERPRTPAADLESLALALVAKFGRPVLLKGGHLPSPQVVNILADRRGLWRFTSRRIGGVADHGAGCMTAAALTAFLAHGEPLAEAAAHALAFVHRAFRRARRIGPTVLPSPDR